MGEVAAIETTMAAAEHKLQAMRDTASRTTTVSLGMPDFHGAIARRSQAQLEVR